MHSETRWMRGCVGALRSDAAPAHRTVRASLCSRSRQWRSRSRRLAFAGLASSACATHTHTDSETADTRHREDDTVGHCAAIALDLDLGLSPVDRRRSAACVRLWPFENAAAPVRMIMASAAGTCAIGSVGVGCADCTWKQPQQRDPQRSAADCGQSLTAAASSFCARGSLCAVALSTTDLLVPPHSLTASAPSRWICCRH